MYSYTESKQTESLRGTGRPDIEGQDCHRPWGHVDRGGLWATGQERLRPQSSSQALASHWMEPHWSGLWSCRNLLGTLQLSYLLVFHFFYNRFLFIVSLMASRFIDVSSKQRESPFTRHQEEKLAMFVKDFFFFDSLTHEEIDVVMANFNNSINLLNFERWNRIPVVS